MTTEEFFTNILQQNEVIITLLARLVWTPEKLAAVVMANKRNPDAYVSIYNALDGEKTGVQLAALAGVTKQGISFVLQSWVDEGIVLNVGTDNHYDSFIPPRLEYERDPLLSHSGECGQLHSRLFPVECVVDADVRIWIPLIRHNNCGKFFWSPHQPREKRDDDFILLEDVGENFFRGHACCASKSAVSTSAVPSDLIGSVFFDFFSEEPFLFCDNSARTESGDVFKTSAIILRSSPARSRRAAASPAFFAETVCTASSLRMPSIRFVSKLNCSSLVIEVHR